jgi:hypothetical protein
MHKGLHMLTFEGINNINDIEYLKGETIMQERDHEEIELGEHEFYYSATHTSFAPVSKISVTRPIGVSSSSNTVQPMISE